MSFAPWIQFRKRQTPPARGARGAHPRARARQYAIRQSGGGSRANAPAAVSMMPHASKRLRAARRCEESGRSGSRGATRQSLSQVWNQAAIVDDAHHAARNGLDAVCPAGVEIAHIAGQWIDLQLIAQLDLVHEREEKGGQAEVDGVAIELSPEAASEYRGDTQKLECLYGLLAATADAEPGARHD